MRQFDVLEPVDVPDPAPGAGEVLVQADAIGVNYFDLLIRTGRYRWMPGLPFIHRAKQKISPVCRSTMMPGSLQPFCSGGNPP